MLYIINEKCDPAFNLAAEEYLLGMAGEPVFMVWRSRSSVIIGRNQNPYRQADTFYLDRIGAPVLRRISGGGAVYHDTGNINFTLIRPSGGKPVVDYHTPLRPIRRFLNQMGVTAGLDGSNGLVAGGKKISGNAQHIHKGKVLHHGTLLFDADLDVLARALRPAPHGRYQDRSVDSVRQPVANLLPLLKRKIPIRAFMEQLAGSVQADQGGRRIQFSPADEAAIGQLAHNRYHRWQWNYGRTPAYRFSNTIQLGGHELTIAMRVSSGTIHEIEFSARDLNARFMGELRQRLQGCRHSRADVADALSGDLAAPPLTADVRKTLAKALF